MARVSRKYHKITLWDEVRVGLYARLSVKKLHIEKFLRNERKNY